MNRDAIAFRAIEIARDEARCVRFRRDAYVCSFGDDARFDEQHGSDAEYIAWLQELASRCPEAMVHAWRGSEIVGQIEMTILPPGETSYVNLFYLVPQERGTGAGDGLHAYALHVLQEQRVGVVDLHVAPENLRAVRYYEKHGWKDLGPGPNGEVHRMRLRLAS